MGNGDQRKFTKNPCHFSMQNSQANTKKKSTKVFWRVGKVIHLDMCNLLSHYRYRAWTFTYSFLLWFGWANKKTVQCKSVNEEMLIADFGALPISSPFRKTRSFSVLLSFALWSAVLLSMSGYRGIYPASHKRCYLNGVFQSGVFRP